MDNIPIVHETPEKGEQVELQSVDYSRASARPQYTAAACVTLVAFYIGMCLGWSSPVEGPVCAELQLSTAEFSWVAALLNAGCLVGGLLGGSFIDRFGRKGILVSVNIVSVIGYILLLTAQNAWMLYIGRVVCGLSAGLFSVAVPTYTAEIAVPSIRGTLGNLFQMQVVLGILATSLLGLGPADAASSFTWRWLTAVSLVVPLIATLAATFVPESPYWLVRAGRLGEAEASLRWLRGDDSGHDVAAELRFLDGQARIQAATVVRLADLTKPWAVKPLVIVALIMFFQQWCGINAALFFAVNIFEAAGSTLAPAVSAVLINLTNVVMTLPAVVLVDKLGRRVLLLTSIITMMCSMVALGVFFYLQENDPETAETLGWLPLVSLIAFIAGFAIGFGPLAWLLMSELVPEKVKGPASSVATFLNWTFAFIVVLTFVDVKAGLTDAGAFWFYAGICFVGTLFCFFFVPETAGKTPQQIQEHFGTFVN